jgi:hypothetical protein
MLRVGRRLGWLYEGMLESLTELVVRHRRRLAVVLKWSVLHPGGAVARWQDHCRMVSAARSCNLATTGVIVCVLLLLARNILATYVHIRCPQTYSRVSVQRVD